MHCEISSFKNNFFGKGLSVGTRAIVMTCMLIIGIIGLCDIYVSILLIWTYFN
jgi:hypothetical protein